VRVTVRVPATSANLGPGFDCFGLALDLCNEVTVDTEAEPGVSWEGEGADELPTDGSDMVSRAMQRVAMEHGMALPSSALRGVNRIPLERGLGSSAAASVAGIAIGGRLLGVGVGPEEIVRFAVEAEGHPDNAAAVVHGGLTIALPEGDVIRVDVHPDLRPVLFVPETRSSTYLTRRTLPDEVHRSDAVFNIGHAALAALALTSRPDLLGIALDDRLHQWRRLSLVPEVRDLFEDLRAKGVPVCLSGAGPSLLAFERGSEEVPDPGDGWRVLRPSVRSNGVEVLVEN
jgi:homoserine kinase